MPLTFQVAIFIGNVKVYPCCTRRSNSRAGSTAPRSTSRAGRRCRERPTASRRLKLRVDARSARSPARRSTRCWGLARVAGRGRRPRRDRGVLRRARHSGAGSSSVRSAVPGLSRRLDERGYQLQAFENQLGRGWNGRGPVRAGPTRDRARTPELDDRVAPSRPRRALPPRTDAARRSGATGRSARRTSTGVMSGFMPPGLRAAARGWTVSRRAPPPPTSSTVCWHRRHGHAAGVPRRRAAGRGGARSLRRLGRAEPGDRPPPSRGSISQRNFERRRLPGGLHARHLRARIWRSMPPAACCRAGCARARRFRCRRRRSRASPVTSPCRRSAPGRRRLLPGHLQPARVSYWKTLGP